MGNENSQIGESDALFKRILYREQDIVCKTFWKERLVLILPILLWLLLIGLNAIIESAAPRVNLPVLNVILAGSGFLVLFSFLSELRYPRIVEIRDGRLIVKPWFGKPREAPVEDVEIYGFDPPENNGTYTFIASGFSFRLPSTMTNFMLLIDAIETKSPIGQSAMPHKPNRVVSADRNPRERGLRPLNNNR